MYLFSFFLYLFIIVFLSVSLFISCHVVVLYARDWSCTGSSVVWFVEMNLSVQNHNHYTTAKTVYSVAQEREIEGMLC